MFHETAQLKVPINLRREGAEQPTPLSSIVFFLFQTPKHVVYESKAKQQKKNCAAFFKKVTTLAKTVGNTRGSRKPWQNSNRMQQEKWGEKEGKAVVAWRRENKHT